MKTLFYRNDLNNKGYLIRTKSIPSVVIVGLVKYLTGLEKNDFSEVIEVVKL